MYFQYGSSKSLKPIYFSLGYLIYYYFSISFLIKCHYKNSQRTNFPRLCRNYICSLIGMCIRVSTELYKQVSRHNNKRMYATVFSSFLIFSPLCIIVCQPIYSSCLGSNWAPAFFLTSCCSIIQRISTWWMGWIW